ncbi:siderophore-interacting protein [Amycolatopsis cihanbeyliensis]|uniref:NADPH-dependent ferric siderophore reductase n=1 Tax=Amycolatopsis cihanbeyliensis TaxID=1128664 RepID=A0A542DPC1_AMYCI|nr:siderophore-interacting protein [Amycolatopsis cihanbeyliensis]TQJ04907.1 NADPH-dependent ferric siderophore reductase [Amycolatopsis cihanbeyliensis]
MTSTAQNAGTALAYRAVRVTGVRRLTPHMARISFTGCDQEGLSALPPAAPDQYVKVFFPLPHQERPQLPPPLVDDAMSWYRTYLAMPDEVRPPMRTYTIRAHRPAAREIDIDFVLHADGGPAATWAASARPGDEVAVLGPHGLYSVPEGAEWQLLIGDESALPAIGAILEALPEGAHARAFVEVAGPEEEQELPSAGSSGITWIHRDGGAHGERLLAAVREAELPGGTPYAWIAGEAGLVKLARRHLVREREFDKRAITFTGYWRLGRTEEDTGRENIRKLESGEPLDAPTD